MDQNQAGQPLASDQIDDQASQPPASDQSNAGDLDDQASRDTSVGPQNQEDLDMLLLLLNDEEHQNLGHLQEAQQQQSPQGVSEISPSPSPQQQLPPQGVSENSPSSKPSHQPQQPQQPQSKNKRKASGDNDSTHQPKRARQDDPNGGAPSLEHHGPNGGQSHGNQGPPTSNFSQPGPSQQPPTEGPSSSGNQQNPPPGNQQGSGAGAHQNPGPGNQQNPGFSYGSGHPGPGEAPQPQPPPQSRRGRGRGSGFGRGAGRGRGRGRGNGNPRAAAAAGRGAGRGRGGGRGAIQLGPGAGGWHDIPIEMHPGMANFYNQAHDQGRVPPQDERFAIEERVNQEMRDELDQADDAIHRNVGNGAFDVTPMADPVPVPRNTYTVDQWPEACNHCRENGFIGCNIQQNHPKECDNCTYHRYNVFNHPESMDHDCNFTPGHNRGNVTAERKKPEGQVVNFLQPLLWQCDACALDGRYCDADRLMSVKCTTCASLGRVCTVRRSPPLRERDYLRALERGFRIMCRLCSKAGKRCSWADSTLNYGSGRPCPECLPFENDEQDKFRYGACTTYSTIPLTVSSGIITTLPPANVLPALDDQGWPLFIEQRRPWRNVTNLGNAAKARRTGNGVACVFKDPNDPDYGPRDAQKNPDGRRPCEFCYYTNAMCEMGHTDRHSACKNCTYIGIKCIERGGREMPDGRLARVPRRFWNLGNGLGGYMRKLAQFSSKFKHCTNCKENNRMCDRKRPCESCEWFDAQCDNAVWGEGTFVADRHPGDRGHTYYVGLGYGPEALGSAHVLRDPTRMLCGPKRPLDDGVPHAPNEANELERATRCFERENQLMVQYGHDYRPPGSGWFPPGLMVDGAYPDPTDQVGWPGSYIRIDREPVQSRTSPIWALHPPGIANYPTAGIEEGGPDDGGPPPGPGGDPEDLPDSNPGGSLDEDELFGPANTGGQSPPQNPTPQGQSPVDEDEVMSDAQTQDNQAGPAGSSNGTPPTTPPPGMNPFIPVDVQQDPTTAPPPNAAPPDPLSVFKLGTEFTGVERFMAQGYTGDSLEESPIIRSPTADEREVEPLYPWGVVRVEAEVQNPRIAALNQIKSPGNNVLRNIPEVQAAQEAENRSCRDIRPPEFVKCHAVDGHAQCENLRHEDVFPVCADCDMASKRHIWTREVEGGGVGITMGEILLMRAYYCENCSQAATNPFFWHGTGHSVYGFREEERLTADPSKGTGPPWDRRRVGGWKSNVSRPITGCNCAEKLLDRVLCTRHRLFLAQKMIRQAAMMQEYRFRRYGTKICPTCQDRPGLDSMDAPLVDNVRYFWACLVCNGRVASEEQEGFRIILAGPEAEGWYGGELPLGLRHMHMVPYLWDFADDDFDIEQRQ